MSRHQLQGRREEELLWFQRRSFLQAGAAWIAAGGYGAALAQTRSNVVQLSGDALVNGQRLTAQQTIQPGDQIVTGPNSKLVFVIGTSAFHVRENSTLSMERSLSAAAVGLLRLVTGAVVSVWGKGDERKIVTPTITAGIRGTGVYTEVMANQGGRSYFCNCYGTVDLKAGADQTTSESEYHQGFWGEVEPRNGRLITPAGAFNHTDEEVEFLAQLVDQKTAWQVTGRKGKKTPQGYSAPGGYSY